MNWIRERAGAYFSSDNRYCIVRVVSTACGPWVVHHDPRGEAPGWGGIVITHANSLKDAKAKVMQLEEAA
jgi:hypothetical protein